MARAFSRQGHLARYVKLRVVHAPGMPGTFSHPSPVSDPDMHHGTCVMHVQWCMPGSLTSGFLWSRWRGKRSRHSRRMCNPQFYVSSKRLKGWGQQRYLPPRRRGNMAIQTGTALDSSFDLFLISRILVIKDPNCSYDVMIGIDHGCVCCWHHLPR